MSAESRSRMDELLVDRALVGLGAGESLELERLEAELGAEEGFDLELAAAELHLALAPPEPLALPEELRALLGATARQYAPAAPAPRPAPAAPRPAAPSSGLLRLGWLVAAAAALLAVFLGRRDAVPTTAELRTALLDQPDAVHLEWSAPDPSSAAGGDLVWSQTRQAGVMRLRNLAPNDPSQEQYQLWIFDASQENPVDGGVFDVAGAEVLVPIDAKLRVATPTLFAVTREKPGGVVVSDRQRIVLVAEP